MLNHSMQTEEREVYTVSQLNQETRHLLEGHFPLVWVEGEISNIARPSSGHIYFSLKDENAQVRCAMFRMRNSRLRFSPENGTQVLLRAKVSLYEGRGDFQLIAEHMEEAGDGALRRAFDALQLKLQKEGLFAEDIKKSIPALPQSVGIITSATGAALHDILRVLDRRFPLLPIIIYPTMVQGKTAAAEIANTIAIANKRQEVELLILARGGGSLEDLWAFNEEILARAIHASELPIVTGVGHEVDFTIADFVADHRAATPSAAAEFVSPDQQELLNRFIRWEKDLISQAYGLLDYFRQELTHLAKRLQHPGRKLQEQAQRLDTSQLRLTQAIRHILHVKTSQLARGKASLKQQSPDQQILRLQSALGLLKTHVSSKMAALLQQHQSRLTNLGRALNAVSPLATLDRGYAIATQQDGSVIRRVKGVKLGESINTRLADGELSCTITKIRPVDA